MKGLLTGFCVFIEKGALPFENARNIGSSSGGATPRDSLR